MNIQQQIDAYIDGQPEPKQSDMKDLHRLILNVMSGCKLWFDSGKDSENKVVSNPTIGYGHYTIKYADGKTKDFFQIGLSGNKTGISLYILGIKDKTYLSRTFADTLGKAKITGYCIRFKALKDLNIDVLKDAIRSGVEASLS